ncbi:MAG TPA: hypothetical protein VH478_05505 [Trebonia sp.]|nr:hypothetical protein [Trebonia sp.]
MGLAGMSSLTGVWKIGNGHVEDLFNGVAKVDMSRANFVTRDDFEAELGAWRLGLLPT